MQNQNPERIGMKFDAVDYFQEICPQTKFCDSQMSGAAVGICEIYDVCYVLYRAVEQLIFLIALIARLIILIAH